MTNLEQLQAHYASFVQNVNKFNKSGMDAPGFRAREDLKAMYKLIRPIRKDIQDRRQAKRKLKNADV